MGRPAASQHLVDDPSRAKSPRGAADLGERVGNPFRVRRGLVKVVVVVGMG